jgi:hypothetical protein
MSRHPNLKEGGSRVIVEACPQDVLALVSWA